MGEGVFHPRWTYEKTFQIIDDSDVVIIDLSEKGVGLGIEAGYAYSRGIPVIAIANKPNISTTLLGISKYNCVYTGREDLVNFLKVALE